MLKQQRFQMQLVAFHVELFQLHGRGVLGLGREALGQDGVRIDGSGEHLRLVQVQLLQDLCKKIIYSKY